MPNYEQFKQAWNSMGNAERRKYTEQYKNDSQFQQFANQYSQEMKNQDSSGVNNQNNVSNMNGGTNTQQDTTTTQNQTNANGGNGSYDPIYYRENNSENNNTENNQNVKVAEDFDSSRLTNPNAEVSVKEGTAAQTGLPDYQADSDARDNEIVNNLNSYYNTNKSFFTDRDTFNKTFHYSERNDRQKALLDSFWKGKEDKDKAAGYTTGSSITQGFDSAQITPDIMNYIREYNPEAYAEWQKAMQDEVNKRIANFAVPRTATQTADIWQDLVKQLGLEQGDPYQIYDNWYGMCESLGVFAKNRQLDQYIAEMEQVKSERTAAIQRTMKEGAGKKSQSLINAEVAKTSALYDTRFADLQNQYNAVYNQRQQNLAIAKQSAQALQMQGKEDSRVFNNKLAGLGFAMKVDDYRTPEQQAQLGLQTAAIQADLSLLNQSKSNDLALYNKYATVQLENRLSSELSDLNVKDENQLRSNLNNILSQYYSKYGDIIKRSQPQVVDDVLRYAKENGISVAEALTKNFIEPLQSKQEYKNMIAKNYADPNASQQNWSYSIGEDGKLKVDVKGVGNLNLTEVQKEALLANKKTYPDSGMKGAGLRNNNPGNIKDTGFGNVLGTDGRGFAIFLTPEDGFDALVEKIQNIQRGGSKTYSSNMSLYDFFSKYAPSSDNNNPKAYAESVAKQLGTTANATVGSVDAKAFAAAIAKHDSGYDASTYGNFRNASTYSDVGVTTNTNNITTAPYESAIGTTSTGAEINAGGWITSLEKTFGSTQRMSNAERKELYSSYGIDKQTYDKMEYNYAKYLEKTEGVKSLETALERAKDLLQWNKTHQGRHSGTMDIETAENGYYSFLGYKSTTDAADGKAKFDLLKNSDVLNKFLDLKKNNASFGAMSEGEWDIIGGATNELKWLTSDENFEASLESYIKTLESNLAKLDDKYSKPEEEVIADTYFPGAYNTGFNNTLSGVTNFIING